MSESWSVNYLLVYPDTIISNIRIFKSQQFTYSAAGTISEDKMDPGTAITRWAIRRAVSEGYVPSRRVGNKYVFNLDTLLDYFDVKVS